MDFREITSKLSVNKKINNIIERLKEKFGEGLYEIHLMPIKSSDTEEWQGQVTACKLTPLDPDDKTSVLKNQVINPMFGGKTCEEALDLFYMVTMVDEEIENFSLGEPFVRKYVE